MVKQKHENDKRHRFFFRSYRYIRGMYVGGRIRVPSCQKPMGVRGVRGELIPKERQERKRRKKRKQTKLPKTNEKGMCDDNGGQRDGFGWYMCVYEL